MASEVLDLGASNKKAKADFCNEDLLILILLSLPPKSIFRFRSVSKTWNNIISTPFFLQNYQRRAIDSQCLLAFIVSKPYKILPLASINHDFKSTNKLLSDYIFGSFINSSNGLTLWFNSFTYQLKILNPLTGKTVSLPDLPQKADQEQCLALICEKSEQELVANYKVLVVNESAVDKTLIMNTYSSKTSKWTSSALMVKENVRWRKWRPSLVMNGIVYWPERDDYRLVVYDSNTDHVQLIRLPRGVFDFRIAWSSGDDELWLGNKTDNVLKFWTLPKGGSDGSSLTAEWILRYSFSCDDLVKEIGEMFGVSLSDKFWLEALIPGKPHIVLLQTKGRLLLYNMESKSVEEIMEYHRIVALIYPYMEPFCLSSYAI